MIHPDTEVQFINSSIGYGVVAKKLIPRGTITWVQDELDQIFTPENIANLSPLMQGYLETYCFTNGQGNKVLCWDHAKYVNHSFNSNCISTAYDFEIAIRDIYPGEQLTDDYGYLNVEEPFTAVDEGLDRKIVYPDDLLRFYEFWDCQVKNNINLIDKVSQPLLPFIDKNLWKEFEEVLQDKKQLKSILTCYFNSNGKAVSMG